MSELGRRSIKQAIPNGQWSPYGQGGLHARRCKWHLPVKTPHFQALFSVRQRLVYVVTLFVVCDG